MPCCRSRSKTCPAINSLLAGAELRCSVPTNPYAGQRFRIIGHDADYPSMTAAKLFRRPSSGPSPAAVARRSASHTIECDPRAPVTDHSGDRLVADSNAAR